MAISYSGNMLNHLLLWRNEGLEESITVSRWQGFPKKLACELALCLISLVAAIETVAYALLTVPSSLVACWDRRPFDRCLELSKSSATTLSIAIPYLVYNMSEQIGEAPRLTNQEAERTEAKDVSKQRLEAKQFLLRCLDPVIQRDLKAEPVGQFKEDFACIDIYTMEFVATRIAYQIVVEKQKVPSFFQEKSKKNLENLLAIWKIVVEKQNVPFFFQKKSKKELKDLLTIWQILVGKQEPRLFFQEKSQKELENLLLSWRPSDLTPNLTLLAKWINNPRDYLEVYDSKSLTPLEQQTFDIAQAMRNTLFYEEIENSGAILMLAWTAITEEWKKQAPSP